MEAGVAKERDQVVGGDPVAIARQFADVIAEMGPRGAALAGLDDLAFEQLCGVLLAEVRVASKVDDPDARALRQDRTSRRWQYMKPTIQHRERTLFLCGRGRRDIATCSIQPVAQRARLLRRLRADGQDAVPIGLELHLLRMRDPLLHAVLEAGPPEPCLDLQPGSPAVGQLDLDVVDRSIALDEHRAWHSILEIGNPMPASGRPLMTCAATNATSPARCVAPRSLAAPPI